MKVLVTGLFLVIVADLSHQAANSSEPIYVLTNVKNVVVANRRLAHFSTMFDSVIRGSQRRPLHWLIFTNTADVTTINVLVRKILADKSQVPVKVSILRMLSLLRTYVFFC
jgi:hypothetical protein